MIDSQCIHNLFKCHSYFTIYIYACYYSSIPYVPVIFLLFSCYFVSAEISLHDIFMLSFTISSKIYVDHYLFIH